LSYTWSEDVTESEVDQPNVILFIKKDVFRFDIAMDQIQLSVKIAQTDRHLAEDSPAFGLRERTPRTQQPSKAAMLCVLHHEIEIFLVLEDLEQLNHVLMHNRLQNASFATDSK
jgi:hypothetical protein